MNHGPCHREKPYRVTLLPLKGVDFYAWLSLAVPMLAAATDSVSIIKRTKNKLRQKSID